jgi:hypothetical protein
MVQDLDSQAQIQAAFGQNGSQQLVFHYTQLCLINLFYWFKAAKQLRILSNKRSIDRRTSN